MLQVLVQDLDFAGGERLLRAGHHHGGGVVRYAAEAQQIELRHLEQVVAQAAAGTVVVAGNVALAMAGEEVDDALPGAGHLQERAGKGVLGLEADLRAEHLPLPGAAHEHHGAEAGGRRADAVLARQVGAQFRILHAQRQQVGVGLVLGQQVVAEVAQPDQARIGRVEERHHLDRLLQLFQHLLGLGGEGELGQAGKVEAVVHPHADALPMEPLPSTKSGRPPAPKPEQSPRLEIAPLTRRKSSTRGRRRARRRGLRYMVMTRIDGDDEARNPRHGQGSEADDLRARKDSAPPPLRWSDERYRNKARVT